jgi:hypothetical protein
VNTSGNLTVDCGGPDCGNHDTSGGNMTVNCNSNDCGNHDTAGLYDTKVSMLIQNLLNQKISLATTVNDSVNIDCGSNCGNHDTSAGPMTINCGGPHCGNHDTAGLFDSNPPNYLQELLNQKMSLATTVNDSVNIDCGSNCGNHDTSAGPMTINCGGPNCGNWDTATTTNLSDYLLYSNPNALVNQNLNAENIWAWS